MLSTEQWLQALQNDIQFVKELGMSLDDFDGFQRQYKTLIEKQHEKVHESKYEENLWHCRAILFLEIKESEKVPANLKYRYVRAQEILHKNTDIRDISMVIKKYGDYLFTPHASESLFFQPAAHHRNNASTSSSSPSTLVKSKSEIVIGSSRTTTTTESKISASASF